MSRFWQAWKRRKQMLRDQALHQRSKKSMDKIPDIPVSPELEANVTTIQRLLGSSDDLLARHFVIGPQETGKKAVLVYFDTLVDKKVIDEFILEYLGSPLDDRERPAIHTLESVRGMQKLLEYLLAGMTILLIEGKTEAIVCGTFHYAKRGIEEPQSEALVRGSREGFNESLSDGVSLIRKRLKDPALRVRLIQVGERTRTPVNVLFIEDLAPEDVVREIVNRIKGIQIDGILESGYIEQMIQDSTWSPFPQIQATERPDKVVAHLLEGKVAILTEGTPFALIAPAIFTQFYQSAEDYYERFLISSMIRLIRMMSLFVALLLPSLYIAFSSFHPEMIPSRLVIAMAAGRSTVPFPSVIEAFLMEITMEILREASIRLPGPIGPTIGIVGALVVGQAAVQAGLVSPIMVIIVALTTIGSFATPSYSAAISIRMLRFPLMILAGAFGLYGIMTFLIIIFIHLSALKSFGIPYMTPISPVYLKSMRDFIFRAPFFWMKERPEMFNPPDPSRQNWGEDK
ncbi:spore germination protein [Brevibacillus massiliensis]|uniref:spore germination protein n=1 Tax=Brevibacillus massiliensis TaxID=1118054 RepID=UPI000316ADDD|nr:spore germination protein [Brevibacillus massiliensis]